MNGWTGGRSRYPGRAGSDLVDSLAEATRLRRDGEAARAHRVLTRALHIAQAAAGIDPLALTAARRMLAEVLCELGQLAAAHRVIAPLTSEARQTFGADHPATVRTVAVLAAVVHELGDYDAAEGLYRQVTQLVRDAGGPAGRAASLARVRLALLHRDRGRLNAARDELAAAYAEHREVFGSEDADTVHIGAQLADLHRAAGDNAAARRVLTVAYAGACAGLGEGHPLTRRLENDLAMIEQPMPSAPVDLPGDRRSRSLRRRHARRRAGGGWRAPAPAHRRATGSGFVVPPGSGGRRTRVRQAAWRSAPADRTVLRGLPAGTRGGLAAARPASAAPPLGPGALVGPVPARSSPPTRLVRSGPRRLPDRVAQLWRHGGLRAAAAAAVVAGCALVTTGVLALGQPDDVRGSGRRSVVTDPARGAGGAPASSPAAISVSLRDQGATVTVSWQLGAPAAVLIALVDGPGAAPRVVATVPAGTTSYVLRGLDPQREYCVVVGPVDAAAAVARTATACTSRR